MQRGVTSTRSISREKEKTEKRKQKKEKGPKGYFSFLDGISIFLRRYAFEVWKVFLRREWREISHNVWVAQSAEFVTVNHTVSGSIPLLDASFFNSLVKSLKKQCC